MTEWPPPTAASLGWRQSWSAPPVVRLRIASSLDSGVMIDADMHADVIRRSHSGRSPTFLDVIAHHLILAFKPVRSHTIFLGSLHITWVLRYTLYREVFLPSGYIYRKRLSWFANR